MKCPHCQNAMPAGATVCGSCGAYEETVERGGVLLALPVMLLAFVIVVIGWGALVSLCINLASSGTDAGLVLLIGFIGFWAVPGVVIMTLRAIVPKKKVWTYRA